MHGRNRRKMISLITHPRCSVVSSVSARFALWRTPLGAPLWAHPFGRTLGRTPLCAPLWAHPFGRTPLGAPLWAQPFGRTPLGAPLWAHPFGGHQQISKLLYKSHMKSNTGSTNRKSKPMCS